MGIRSRYFRPLILAASLLSTLALAGCDLNSNDTENEEVSVFSESLRFEGAVVEELPSGLVIRETAIMRGKRFEWDGKAEGLVAEEVEAPSSELAPDIDAISVEELAENLRGVALFSGHRFVEAEPAMELAIQVKKIHELQLDGATAEEIDRILPGRPTTYGSIEQTLELENIEQGEESDEKDELEEPGPGSVGTGVAFLVHGADDRRVMGNPWYPHRTHIVFDNTGSTTAINGSQGSGTLVGPSTALSVAHVFWNEFGDTWETPHRWAPGYDSQDSDPSPYGEWYGCYWVTIPTAYTNGNSGTYDFAILNFDTGCNSTSNGVNSDRPGATVGWLGHYTASEYDVESRTGYLRGYPATGTCGTPAISCNVRVWGDTSSPSENNALSNFIRHQADSSSGQSGSSFYHYAIPGCSGCGYGAYVVGMHRAGFGSYNEASRLTPLVRAFVITYSSDY